MARLARRPPARSLRTILIVWFLLFALLPLFFVTGYSVYKYEKAIDHELVQRLKGNGREIEVILDDYKKNLQVRRDRYLTEPGFVYHLSTGDVSSLKSLAANWIRLDVASSLTFFSRQGRMLASLSKDYRGVIQDQSPAPGRAVFLSEDNLNRIRKVREHSFAEHRSPRMVALILFSRVLGSAGRVVGYIEQVIHLDQNFVNRLGGRLNLEVVFLRANGQITVGTHSDFRSLSSDYFSRQLSTGADSFFDLSLDGDPYGFIFYPVSWGNSDFYMGIGASKRESRAVLRNVNYAFVTVVGTVVVLLIITVLFASSRVLRPLEDLVDAIQRVAFTDQPQEIPVRSDTEVGLLTESFNQMSRNIARARSELKTKISELERTNLELREAQSRLIHSSKMGSLGQVVAGVAHELNNPIGFIYSNMSHLRDYSNRLIQMIEVAEKNPQQLAKLKEELDLDYIKQDLPKLIASCEDGARRTRDIVLGLRNFSRLEEAKLKEIQLHDELERTLNLLSGELRNRIQVHRQYGEIPPVTCYATQLSQVFMNLLSNAIQAIEGPGNIWITTKAFRDPKGRKMVSISIQDSGKGMNSDIIEKIFDPFFSTKGIGQGTGLGLSISYGIIQKHGGDIRVKSQLGIGTEFVVTIPEKAQPSSSETVSN